MAAADSTTTTLGVMPPTDHTEQSSTRSAPASRATATSRNVLAQTSTSIMRARGIGILDARVLSINLSLGKVLPVIRMRQIKKGPLEREKLQCNAQAIRREQHCCWKLAPPLRMNWHGDIPQQSVERHSKNIHAYPNFSLRILHPFDFLRVGFSMSRFTSESFDISKTANASTRSGGSPRWLLQMRLSVIHPDQCLDGPGRR